MRWSAHIPTKFHVLRRTLDPTRVMYKFEYGTLTLYGLLSQVVSLSYIYLTSWSEPQPIGWFRLFPVRSPLLRESIYYLSFPSGTEMFHFPESRLQYLFIQYWITGHYSSWVAPFGYLRINSRVQIPGAFRSLPRPSSPVDAKASFMCP